MPPDIVGIGVCTVDHLMIVPRLPQRNENMRANNYSRQPGGLASCALMAAARLGAKTRIIARIGADDMGAYIRHNLQSEGVDVSLLLAEAGSQSQVSVILVHEATGDRSIITRPPTSQPISPNEIQREDIVDAKLLFIDNLTEATLQAARWAREAGMTVLLDPALPYAEIEPLLAYVDVPIVPEQWARAWLPDQPSSRRRPASASSRRQNRHRHLGRARRGSLLGRGHPRRASLSGRCGGYHRRRRCLSRRFYVRPAARLGCAADGAVRLRRRFDELPRYRRAQRTAHPGASGAIHRPICRKS